MTETIQKAAEVIAAAPSLAITCHVGPDGDALGSALALAHAARHAGIPAVVSFGEPFVVPESLQFLDLEPLISPKEFPQEPAVMVVFDVASPDRLGELQTAADAAGTLIVVDHHTSNTGFGDIAVIDPTGAASAELCRDLITAIGWKIDKTVATCLLTGMVTDTGRFMYSATSPSTLRAAAEMLEAGARPEEVGQNVYESVPFGYLAMSSAVLGRAELEEDLSLVWSVALESDMDEADIRFDQLEGLIDDLRIAREADTAALLKQTDGGFKVSLRSRGGTDVSKVAVAGGGGGHANAAGFTMEGTADEVIEFIRSQLRD